MSSILTQDHFEIFSLPKQYVLDPAVLDARYRELQRVVHPDRFAGSSDQERRISIQQAAQIILDNYPDRVAPLVRRWIGQRVRYIDA